MKRMLLRRLAAPAPQRTRALAAQAPELRPATPLTAAPGRAAGAAPARPPAKRLAQRAAALGLPFFDDFTTPLDGLPDAGRWQPAAADYPDGLGATLHYGGGGAYVSNRLAINAPTRGTATLDGLQANGQPYNSNSASFYSKTDTLTSQPIDLSALNTGSNVYLSYAWQAGSLAGVPAASGSTTPVSLTLEFLDSDGRWNTVWTYFSKNKRTAFRQQIFPLSQPGYFHAGFRFRFRSVGNQAISRDAFGLDYIYLNANRSASDTVFQDIATSQGLTSPLRRYVAMPVWQYNAGSGAELNSTLTATVNNLTPQGNPTPISWLGTVRALDGSGFGPATWTSGERPEPAGASQDAITGDASTAPPPTTPAAKRLRYTLALQTKETSPLTLPNDTISRDLELGNYYAYDDGTPEQSLRLPAASQGPTSYLAVAYVANQTDRVSAVQLAPAFNNIPLAAGGENYADRPVTVAVWGDTLGMPTHKPLATATAVLRQADAAQRFYTVNLAVPVQVSGRFYVGYGQPPSGQFLPYGLDLNNQPATGSLFYTKSGVWTAFQPATGGALLLRAVMNNNAPLATMAQQAVSARFALYPNPAPTGTTVRVAGPAFGRATLLDVLGRPVWQQPAAEAGQQLLRLPAALPAGVYLVQLSLADGSTATRRLAVQ